MILKHTINCSQKQPKRGAAFVPKCTRHMIEQAQTKGMGKGDHHNTRHINMRTTN